MKTETAPRVGAMRVMCIICRIRMKRIEVRKFMEQTIIHSMWVCRDCGNMVEIITQNSENYHD